MSSVTVFELFAGAAKSRQPDREASRLEQFLGVIAELTFDGAAARRAGWIRAQLERHGQTIGPFDLLIAGQALAVGRALVTRNHREFSQVPGLLLEDWGARPAAPPR